MTAQRTGSKIFPRTDTGNAELFASMFAKDLRFNEGRRLWLKWRTHWWEQARNGELLNATKRVARERFRRARLLPKSDEHRKEEINWARGSESCERRKAMLDLAVSESPLCSAGADWDSDPLLMGVGNGVVNLETGHLRSGRPADRISMHTSVMFDPAVGCPRWERFLSEIFEGNQDIIGFIQRAAGYSLTGDTSEQCLFLCHGPGANGKGVLFETLRYVFRGYSFNLPFSAFELQGRSGIPNDVAAVAGRRFVTSSETSESSRLNAARIKMLTGGDMVTARLLYKEFFEFKPVAKFWLAFNHKPQVDDDSEGFWRRIHLIRFQHQFKGAERDPHLTAKLVKEATGILAWAVRGCRAWQKQGLAAPEVVNATTCDWREDADPLAAFIEERCTVSASVTCKVGRLREVYGSWAEDGRVRRMTSQEFNSHMEARGFKQERSGHERTRIWQGICPKVDISRGGQEQGGGAVRTDADNISLLLSVVKG